MKFREEAIKAKERQRVKLEVVSGWLPCTGERKKAYERMKEEKKNSGMNNIHLSAWPLCHRLWKHHTVILKSH